MFDLLVRLDLADMKLGMHSRLPSHKCQMAFQLEQHRLNLEHRSHLLRLQIKDHVAKSKVFFEHYQNFIKKKLVGLYRAF